MPIDPMFSDVQYFIRLKDDLNNLYPDVKITLDTVLLICIFKHLTELDKK